MDIENRNRLHAAVVRQIKKMGYPEQFGELIAKNLGSEKTLSRMLGYLQSASPRSAEEIADEMLSIMEDRNRWIAKKEAEEANSRYNEMLYYGLGNDDEE